MSYIIFHIDDETGWPTRLPTPEDDHLSPLARVTWDSLRMRYKAIQRELLNRQREREAKAAEAALAGEHQEIRQGA